MRFRLSTAQWLWIIIGIAFALRLLGLGQQEILGDESGDAFRAIGYIDYLGTSEQTTPIDWYRDESALPWWTKLSFHDIPPLAIIFQHISSLIFGFSIFAVRFPAVMLGTLATLLVFWIARRLFNEKVALWSAGWWAVSGAMVWISRTAILEPYLIFFILLNLHAFLLFVERPRYWWWFGITLGAIGLTKYTGVIVVPIYISYLLLFQRSLFRNWRLYAALIMAAIVLSPVIIYNYYMYKATGHFDLQIAYLLGQDTPEWRGLLGKAQSPFREIYINASAAWGISAIMFLILGMGILWRHWRVRRESVALIGAYLFWTTMLLVVIGSAQRFLALYGPGMVIIFGFVSAYLWERKNLKIIVIAWLIAESAFLTNKIFIAYPDFGVAALDHYFEEEFHGIESGVTPEANHPHLNAMVQKFSDKKMPQRPRALIMIVYNDNIALPTLEWVFYRRFFYQSIPTMFIENFQRTVATQGIDYLKPFTIYFVQSTENTLRNQFKIDKTIGQEFEQWLRQRGFVPVKEIYGQENKLMFTIYKFTLR
ncbi:MAG TPA: glycosyltransferase family 39 protein [Candidatus Paceibacterota bacterium]